MYPNFILEVKSNKYNNIIAPKETGNKYIPNLYLEFIAVNQSTMQFTWHTKCTNLIYLILIWHSIATKKHNPQNPKTKFPILLHSE